MSGFVCGPWSARLNEGQEDVEAHGRRFGEMPTSQSGIPEPAPPFIFAGSRTSAPLVYIHIYIYIYIQSYEYGAAT